MNVDKIHVRRCVVTPVSEHIVNEYLTFEPTDFNPEEAFEECEHRHEEYKKAIEEQVENEKQNTQHKQHIKTNTPKDVKDDIIKTQNRIIKRLVNRNEKLKNDLVCIDLTAKLGILSALTFLGIGFLKVYAQGA